MQVIKFVDAGQSREVTAVDRGILELKSAVENLHAQIDNVQHKIDEFVSFSLASVGLLIS